MNQITLRHPADLAPHPLLRHVPLLQAKPEDPSFAALVEDIREYGVRDPIKVTKTGEIVDGRRRWTAAKRLQIDVPAIEVDEEDAPMAIIASVAHRTYPSEGARAYLLVPVIDDAFDASLKRKLGNLRKGEKAPEPNSVRFGGNSVAMWADHIGVSARYLEIAKELRDLFAAHADRKWSWNDSDVLALIGADRKAKLTFREYYEPQILRERDPIGLGAAKSGIKSKLQQDKGEGAGKTHGGGRPEKIEKQLRLFADTFEDLAIRYEYWTGWAEPERVLALQSIHSAVETMPDDLLDEMAKELRREIAKRKTKSEG